MHAILGFTECFSGHYFCRLCLIEKADAQNVYNEDDPKIILRGKELFEMQRVTIRPTEVIRVWFKEKFN